jgi:putative two-component system response regulator
MRKLSEEELVARLSEILAEKCGLHPAVIKRLHDAAILHDVGKVAIPVEILNKPGKLDPNEFEIMKTHTTEGAALLSDLDGDFGEMARNIAKFHHEWWDASNGYYGKYTSDLPMYVSIVAICDVLIAMLSMRVYKPAYPMDVAIDYIRKQAGTQFNPTLVAMLLSLIVHDESIQALLAEGGFIEQR